MARQTDQVHAAAGIKSSAGKSKGNGSTGHGNRYLARVLGEAAVGAARTSSFLGARYRRIARRRGKKKAIVAVGRSILIIVWHLISNPHARYHDLGPDHFDRHVSTDAIKRSQIRQLQASATRSTSNQQPEPRPSQHNPSRLRRELPPAKLRPIFGLGRCLNEPRGRMMSDGASRLECACSTDWGWCDSG